MSLQQEQHDPLFAFHYLMVFTKMILCYHVNIVVMWYLEIFKWAPSSFWRNFPAQFINVPRNSTISIPSFYIFLFILLSFLSFSNYKKKKNSPFVSNSLYFYKTIRVIELEVVESTSPLIGKPLPLQVSEQSILQSASTSSNLSSSNDLSHAPNAWTNP